MEGGGLVPLSGDEERIIDTDFGIAPGNDVLFRAIGHGHDMDVYIHPTDGSETDTTITYGPGGEWLG